MTLSKPAIRVAAVVAAGIAGALLVLSAWNLPPFRTAVESTENAYVRGRVTVISPQVAGYVTAVPVSDFADVKAGDLLAQIDDRIFRQRLLQAEASLAARRAALSNSQQSEQSAQAQIRSVEAQNAGARAAENLAEANEGRIEALLPRGITTQSAADQARSSLAQAQSARRQAEAALEVARQDLRSILVNREALQADIAGAEAAVRLAAIDLQNTRILAPVDGRLGEIGVRQGQYVATGTQLTALVPPQRWVVANFKETQLHGMRTGLPVRFTVDALRHAEMRGRIEEFSPATGSEFAVLRADNATGNFTKVAQRLPVRIAIDPDQALTALLAPGMSVVVHIDTGAAPAPVAVPAAMPGAAPETPRPQN